MLKIDRENRVLEPIESHTLIQAGLKERADLQDLIKRSPKAFFEDIGLRNAELLDQEVKPAPNLVGDSIDLLAYDKDGTVIVIELKRGSNKLHLLQAISYAAMIAKWEPTQFRELNQNRDLGLEDGAKINSAQRIVLVADAFEYEVLTTAEWLVETYELDILCIRVQVAKDIGSGAEYLSCERAYPPFELSEIATLRGRSGKRSANPTGPSPDATPPITMNADVAAFFEDQRTKVRFDEKNKALKYVVGPRIEWSVTIQKRDAGVWQYRRFSGDLEFWRQRLSNPAEVEEKEQGRALSFHLENKADFDAFRDALTNASKFEWQSKPQSKPRRLE